MSDNKEKMGEDVGAEEKSSQTHHHSSGHSHSHSHSHRRRRRHGIRRKKTEKNQKSRKKLSKKDIKNICVAVATAIVVIVAVLLIYHFEGNLLGSGDGGDKGVMYNGDFVVKPVVFGSSVDCINDVAKSCYLGDSVAGRFKQLSPSGLDCDTHKAVVLTPEIHNMPFGEHSFEYKVEISQRGDFADSEIYYFDIDEEIEIEYLKTNCKYYYRVSIVPTDFSYTGSFVTSDTVRILDIGGIGNVRDVGNWKTADGKRIRQGLIYRGTEMDGMVESSYKLTEEGKRVMLDVLGIKYDMDLRGSYANPTNISALGDGVGRKYYDCIMYKAIFSDDGKHKIKETFSDLANPDNYPMYMHCTYGMDRTGTVCFLLEAMLGVSDEDLRRDYELSILFAHSLNDNDFNSMLIALDAYEGDTTQEKVTNYLLECGITEDELASIREILLVDEDKYNAE